MISSTPGGGGPAQPRGAPEKGPAPLAPTLFDQPLSSIYVATIADQDFPDYPTFGCYVADDFENAVPWTISNIFIPADGWNGFSSLLNATSLNWTIYADSGGIPSGNPAAGSCAAWSLSLPPGHPAVAISNGYSGMPSDTYLTLPIPLTLPPGRWWLVFWPQMAFSPFGQFGREPADTANYSGAQWINPAGGFGSGTTWFDWNNIDFWLGQDAAFRLEGTVAAPLWVVSNTNDTGPGSLRWVVASAPAGSTVTFDPCVTGVIALTSGEIVINKALTIIGPGAGVLAVDAGGGGRIFNHAAGALSISGLTIRNGFQNDHGGGIYSVAPLSLTDCVISGNRAWMTQPNPGGGGIYASGGLTLDRCTLSGNRMENGGGGGAVEVYTSSCTFTNCTFSGNYCSGAGAILFWDGTGGGPPEYNWTLWNCTITNNSTGSYQFNPGGFEAGYGVVHARDCIVAGNNSANQYYLFAASLDDQGGNLLSGDPLVAPLDFYGGPTPTHALICGSPAIDFAVPGFPPLDQRFVPRPQYAAGDSGSFENLIVLSTAPSPVPNGQAGVPYAGATFSASGGVGPYIFTVSGTLPPGLILAPDGLLSGTPTTLGTWTFLVLAWDFTGYAGVCRYTIAVTCPTVTLSPVTLPAMTASVPFSATVTASPLGTIYSYSVTAGSLPAGISLNGPTGDLYGTPTIAGPFDFTVQAAGWGGTCTGNLRYQGTIACPAITVNPPTLPGMTAGSPYTFPLQAVPLGTAYTYSVTAGSLPAGLNLSPAGVFTGTPTIAGPYDFTVQAAGWGGSCTGTRQYTGTVACPAITLAPPGLPPMTASVPIAPLTITASPAGTTYTYTISAGSLPEGLNLSPAGVLTGAPTVAGPFNFTVLATGWGGSCTGTRLYGGLIACPAITLDPATLPGLMASVPYSAFVTASPAGGSYTYSISLGSLPAGLGLNGSTGEISGTPAVAGPYDFTVRAAGWGGTCTATRRYQGTIVCPVITLAPVTLPPMTASVPYSATVTASPPGGNYTFDIIVGIGGLPPGLSLNGSTGEISGTPTVAGAYLFRVRVRGWGDTCFGEREYQGTIACPPNMTLVPNPPLPGGIVGQTYSQTFAAGPPGTTYTYAINGSIPPSLTLDPNTGALSGTLTAAGTYNFTITATGWGICTVSQNYTFAAVCPTITVAPATVPGGVVGTAYPTLTFSASGGNEPYTFAVTSGTLPPGLAVSGTGVLSGIPAAAGYYLFAVAATDRYGCIGVGVYVVEMVCPAVAIGPPSLPGSLAGTAYDQQLAASGGTAPCRFSLAGGVLPPGLVLSASGQIGGIPTAGGTYTFTVTATDAYGCSASRTYAVVIRAFDLNFLDNNGRATLCVNSVTGAWAWTVLAGPGLGTYGGVGILERVNNIVTLTSAPGEPWTLTAKYFENMHKATGSFAFRPRRINSYLTDSNTLNNPPACQ